MKNKKLKKALLVIVVAIIGFITKNQNTQTNFTSLSRSQKTTSNKNIDYILTRHAKCRMKCRHIDKGEIKNVLNKGKLNRRKSDPTKKPCPVKSLEGYSKKDNQHIRVVAAYCPSTIKIITVIDLKNKYDCYCK